MFFDKIEAKESIEELEKFKDEYDSLMKYSVKQVGRVLEQQEDFDEDELYGMMTILLKKSMSLADSALNLVTWQCETLKSIDNRLEKIEKKKEK